MRYLTLLLLAPLAARAHPGHENDLLAESWWHLLAEHALPAIGAVLVIAWIVRRLQRGERVPVRRRSLRRP